MKKERPDMETFAAGIADKEDNPTIYELAKQFPEKTYRELENYRDSDRHEEAKQVPLTQAQRDLVEHLEAGACIMGEMRKDREETNWKEKYDKEHKLRQEAEGELTILKGIETNRVKEAQNRSNHLQDELDRVKKDNNGLYNRVAELIQIDESHQKLNGKLQVRIAELEDDNKKMYDHLDKQIEAARKAGL